MLGEVYKHCDSKTRRSLRHTCHATYTSPSINSQLNTLKLSWHSTHGLAAVQLFPKLALLRKLELDQMSSPQLEAFFHHSSGSEACRHKLSSLREVKLVSGKVYVSRVGGESSWVWLQ
jgi:hypothetical protein